MEQKLIYCCICRGPIDWHTTPEGEVYWTHGHNALPVKDGRCCTQCNENKVLPARLGMTDDRLCSLFLNKE
jgi:hypothetical protein